MYMTLARATSEIHTTRNAGCPDIIVKALAHYPIILCLVRHLDLNSLHDFSATCLQIHNSLSPYRTHLVTQTLRCINDDLDKLQGSVAIVDAVQPRSSRYPSQAELPESPRGCTRTCARDLVDECQNCGTIVCRVSTLLSLHSESVHSLPWVCQIGRIMNHDARKRHKRDPPISEYLSQRQNCVAKAPSFFTLQQRHRRLCRLCQVTRMDVFVRDVNQGTEGELPEPLTAEALKSISCCCTTLSHICIPCRNALRASDTTYMRAWTWRTRYSTFLGGLGTGIGEGSQGVHCGREGFCLASKEVEKEIDCDAAEWMALQQAEHYSAPGRAWSLGTSYLTQEIEGIGGIVKKKVKKRIKVGATVKEFEDERECGGYMKREQDHLLRSWCSWCSRIILATADLESDNGQTST